MFARLIVRTLDSYVHARMYVLMMTVSAKARPLRITPQLAINSRSL